MRSVSVLCVSRRHYSAVLKAARRRGPNSALIVVAVTVDRAGGDGVNSTPDADPGLLFHFP